MNNRRMVKNLLGELPLTAEIYWQLFQHGRPVARSFSLRRTQKNLPDWCAQSQRASADIRSSSQLQRRVWLFCTLRYWIEHGALLGTALSGQGHQVTLSYLPYPSFDRPISWFDVRRNNLYARDVLKAASTVLQPLSLLDVKKPAVENLPSALRQAVSNVSLRDVQYTLQIEEVEVDNPSSRSGQLYRLRQERNLLAAAAAFSWIQSLPLEKRPEVLLTPNGSILEMGAIFETARFLEIPAVTYEFGEQRGRIWLARNSQVMLQETNDLWDARFDQPLTASQWEQIQALYASRQDGRLYQNFARLWQGLPSQGGEQVRQELNLDPRPIVLLAANVIGDSLTLGRQIFSKDMTEWLQRSVQYFASRSEAQLLVRIHPGERYLKGPSVAEVVKAALPKIPDHIRLIEAEAPVNTYDLVEIADLGLAYTTTVGMEMAMSGVPVILGGRTHYRGKGFTLDPNGWDENYRLIEQGLRKPGDNRLTREQVELAWNYAYRFFFEYPCPFPWHLLDFWDELEAWPVSRLLSSEGRDAFAATFDQLVGEPRSYAAIENEGIEAR